MEGTTQFNYITIISQNKKQANSSLLKFVIVFLVLFQIVSLGY